MKIGIVGAGLVGATAAFAMVMRGVGREIVLVDKFPKRAIAEAEDIYHAVPYASPLIVRAGEYADLEGCQAIIIAAGVNQQPGEPRQQLLERNVAVFAEIVPQILQAAPHATFIVATNPVDILTHFTARIAETHDVPAGRVFGSGTALDTARFRALIARQVGVDSDYVQAYVVGEHGDSEILVWSQVLVGGITLDEFLERSGLTLTEADRQQIDDGVRNAAAHIIDGKKATYYGIGAGLAEIVDVILSDRHAIMTVCAPTDDVLGINDVTLSLPRLLQNGRVGESLLSPSDIMESDQLRASAQVLKTLIEQLPAI